MKTWSRNRYGSDLATLCIGMALLVGCRSESERSAMAQMPDRAIAPSASRPARAEAPDVTLRRLWAGSDFNFYASSPSPDGRWVTEIDWSTGDLAVRDLTTGRLHHLTDKGSWDVSVDYAEASRFSPDGERVAYVWHNARGGRQGATGENYEVRVATFAVDGDGIPRLSEPRVVYDGGPLLAYWLYGWSSDDEILTGVYRPDNTTALGMLSLSTGSLRILKSFDWRDPRAALSADGKWIAYDHPPDSETRDRDIYLLPVDGGSERRLIAGPGNDVVLGWTPGGRSLLFHSDRSGSPSVWRLPLSEDGSAGPPELLREDLRNVEPLGFTGESLYFGVVVEQPTFRTATIDYEHNRIMPLPGVFEPPSRGQMRALDWSPDGEHVVHDVHGPVGTRIYVRTSEGDVVSEWDLDLEMRRWDIHWAPDGESVYLPAVDGRGRDGIDRLDLATGELETVRRLVEGETDRSFSISSDGRTLYFARLRTVDGELDESVIDIVEHDLETGEERPIQRVRYRGPVIPSPDGAWLAYKERGPGADPAVQLIPAGGGEPRVLYRAETGTIHALVDWTPDGRYLLFVAAPAYPDPPAELWRVSTAGDAEKIGEIPDWSVDGPALHPDGRTIAYRAGETRGEIWALDGLADASEMAAEDTGDSR